MSLYPYPEPKYPIGFKVKNRFGEEEEVVQHVKTQDRVNGKGRQLFSSGEVRSLPWLYVLRGPSGESPAVGPTAIDDLVQSYGAVDNT